MSLLFTRMNDTGSPSSTIQYYQTVWSKCPLVHDEPDAARVKTMHIAKTDLILRLLANGSSISGLGSSTRTIAAPNTTSVHSARWSSTRAAIISPMHWNSTVSVGCRMISPNFWLIPIWALSNQCWTSSWKFTRQETRICLTTSRTI